MESSVQSLLSPDLGSRKNMHPALLDRFASHLRADTRDESVYLLGSEQSAEHYYVPFEQINVGARLVLVGITPGPTQMHTARRVAGMAPRRALPAEGVLRMAKQAGAFDGMRPRINEMLDHFMIPQKLAIGSAASRRIQSGCLLQRPVQRRNVYRNFPPRF